MLIYLCICLFGDDEVAALGGHSGAENICNLPSSHSKGREVWFGHSLHSASRIGCLRGDLSLLSFLPGARSHLYVSASAGRVGQQDSNLCNTV
jgi:hypothetical protein